MFGGAEYEVGTDCDCMMDCNRAREEMCAVIVVSVAVEGRITARLSHVTKS